MKKFLIFFSAGLAVSAMALYMYNTASNALMEGTNTSGEEDQNKSSATPGTVDKSKKNSRKKDSQLQQSAIQRGQDPDMHSAANSETKTLVKEGKTGNVD